MTYLPTPRGVKESARIVAIAKGFQNEGIRETPDHTFTLFAREGIDHLIVDPEHFRLARAKSDLKGRSGSRPLETFPTTAINGMD